MNSAGEASRIRGRLRVPECISTLIYIQQFSKSRLDRIELKQDLVPSGTVGHLIHNTPDDFRGCLVAELAVDFDDLVLRLLELSNPAQRIQQECGEGGGKRTFPVVIRLTSSSVTRARSCLLFWLYHSVCQKPWAVRFLNMKREGGKLSGSLAMAP